MRSEVRSDSRLFRSLTRSLLRQGIAIRFRAHGRSMFPAIADGDIVEVHPEGSHSAGDVVLLEGEDSIRVHRVMSSAGEQIVTRGDSCFESDAAGKSDSILGRVSAVITDTGRHAPHTLRTRLRQILSRLRGSELLAFRVKL